MIRRTLLNASAVFALGAASLGASAQTMVLKAADVHPLGAASHGCGVLAVQRANLPRATMAVDEDRIVKAAHHVASPHSFIKSSASHSRSCWRVSSRRVVSITGMAFRRTMRAA